MSINKSETIKEYYKYVNNNKYKNFTHLSLFPRYHSTIKSTDISKDFLSKKIAEDKKDLRLKYNVAQIAGDSDTFHKSINIMNFLTNNTLYYGMQTLQLRDTGLDILDFAMKNDFKSAINCRYKTIALVDLLESVGITALPLCLLGFIHARQKPDFDCHFMAHVYLPESKKWIVLDPSFNTYFMKDNNVLNIIELRKELSSGNFPTICGYNFNGSDKKCLNTYKNNFIKNCLEFILTWESDDRFKSLPGITANEKISDNRLNKVSVTDNLNNSIAANFNYVLEPIGDEISKYSTKSDLIYIGIEQLLSIT